MPINENMVQEIVQEVMAKMQIADAPTGKHGIFKEMNDAIEAAKKAELIVKKMSMEQREKIITCIRKKIKENAGRYGTLFLRVTVSDGANFKTCSGYGKHIF